MRDFPQQLAFSLIGSAHRLTGQMPGANCEMLGFQRAPIPYGASGDANCGRAVSFPVVPSIE
jgi:hypothetical protein